MRKKHKWNKYEICFFFSSCFRSFISVWKCQLFNVLPHRSHLIRQINSSELRTVTTTRINHSISSHWRTHKTCKFFSVSTVRRYLFIYLIFRWWRFHHVFIFYSFSVFVQSFRMNNLINFFAIADVTMTNWRILGDAVHGLNTSLLLFCRQFYWSVQLYWLSFGSFAIAMVLPGKRIHNFNSTYILFWWLPVSLRCLDSVSFFLVFFFFISASFDSIYNDL